MVIRRKQRRANATERAEARYRQLQAFLDDARAFEGVSAATVPGIRLRANADERVYLCIRGIFLFETHLDLTEPEGMRPRHPPTPVDRGELAVTDHRAVFTGAKQIRQWAWPSIIGITHAANGSWTAIDVSSRRRQFGLLYDDENCEQIRFSIDLAAATERGNRQDLINRIEADMASAVVAVPELGTLHDTARHPTDAPARDEGWLP